MGAPAIICIPGGSMTRVQSFAPIARPDARILILGSMPGAASLAAGQYYAHERNAFWPVMSALLGFDAAAPYPERVGALQAAHVAVWDVLQACTRPGSLDSRIAKDAQIMNDFVGFLDSHPQIAAVFFNGSAAENCFRRQVLPSLGDRSLSYVRLPSTSPAHAALSVAQKREAWRAILPALS